MKDKTFAKIVVLGATFICLPLFLFIGGSLSDEGDTYRTYDGSFQVIKYNYYQRPTGITITMRDEDSKKVIEAKVKGPCSNLPINKIIKATIKETTKDFGIFERNYYEVIDGKVCL